MSENTVPNTPEDTPADGGTTSVPQPEVLQPEVTYATAQPAPYTPGQEQAPQPGPQYSYANQQGYQQPGYQQQAYQAPAPSSSRTAGIGSSHKDKWVAAILAFLLGTLGIHKFYLGYKNEGIIMLLVSLIGGICLGLGPLVMIVISYIEAVRYVILTQEDFERTYVQGSKGWL